MSSRSQRSLLLKGMSNIAREAVPEDGHPYAQTAAPHDGERDIPQQCLAEALCSQEDGPA
eukprot:CAMPEP_0171140524 /NCGR_PEP_ID=MMETSP0766_2-20121228/138898_1 /TAXON_ID=439317 /ORGANISM="Gambierdiscus australes, Strain CAWD 149" /LENGTH=59 /DNA_ID=CAMNT_0011604221 /DNA_START=66 /DNA_END=243 /DNA_ORIENTATION=+